MRFDASPATQELVKKTVAIDPRTIRVGLVKMGSTLKEIAGVEGKVQWSREGELQEKIRERERGEDEAREEWAARQRNAEK